MKQLQWYGCYQESWGNDLVADAFSHPAKVQPALSRRIIEHMIGQGYIQPGSIIVDPFSGVAGFALACMMNGLHYRGCELEQNFVELGQANIALWNNRYAAHFPGWGTAEIVRGDSRRLAAVLREASGAVSSPPFSANAHPKQELKGKQLEIRKNPRRDGEKLYFTEYQVPDSPGQLGSMKEGDIAAVIDGAISSPPFSDSLQSKDPIINASARPGRTMQIADYGSTEGNLGNLPTGSADAAVTSPPYAETVQGAGEGPGARFDHVTHRGENATKRSSLNGYGQTEGNLGNLAAGAVTSPPFGDSNDHERPLDSTRNKNGRHNIHLPYGTSENNIGNATGLTFWESARDILIELYAVLTPGGYAAFVTGNYRRDGKVVPFGEQWLQLCEAVGFVGIEHITAWKYEPRPAQLDIFGNVHSRDVHRVSFFRRLDNQKNPGNEILSEEVWIVRKPAVK